MLRSLSVRNLVLIDSLDLELGKGLCVLTGETGAGKSILLDALGLAIGNRVDGQLVRSGAESASICASFELDAGHPAHALLADQDYEPADELILRRTLDTDGRSRAFVNGQPAPIAWLRELGKTLVEIEGQSASVGLLNAKNHRSLLDSFAGNNPAAAKTEKTYKNWCSALAELEKAQNELCAARHDEEYLRHVSAELDSLAPEVGEEEKLATERRLLMNRQKLSQAMSKARDAIGGEQPAAARLRSAARIVEQVQEEAGGLADVALKAISRAAIETVEAEAALTDAERELDLDPERLETVEDRLFSLRAAARKHNTDVESLSGLAEEFRNRLDQLERSNLELDRLVETSEAARIDYLAAAKKLGMVRARAAKALDKALKNELPPLRLGGASFSTRIDALEESEFGANGIERVRFEIATNPGAEFGPLEKVASGGERARFLLALKVCLTRSKGVNSLVFDEVDEGVGGAVADAVGERLARLAEEVQVLVVTHSPQVAARSAQHIRVLKESAKKSARVKVKNLDAASRREEIARMLSGARITDEARAAAQSLISGEPS